MTKTALVTGGATGLGREVALRLAARGVAVALADINAEKADGTLAELRGAPGTHLAIHVDLTGSGAPERLALKAEGIGLETLRRIPTFCEAYDPENMERDNVA